MPSSGSVGRQLDHADDHQRRHLAGAAGHGQDQAGEDAGRGRGQDDPPGSSRTWSRRRPASPRASSAGTAASASSVATMTTGTVSRARVSEAHRMPPVPKVGVGSASGKNSRSIAAAHEVDEEAEAEDAEDDRRHAGQVVDRDAHGAHERPLLARTRAGRARPARRAGTTTRLMRKTIITVPKMAGKMPPSVFDSRGSSVRNSHSRLGVDAGRGRARTARSPGRRGDVERGQLLLLPVGGRGR